MAHTFNIIRGTTFNGLLITIEVNDALLISLAFNALLFVSVVVLIAMHKYRTYKYREMRDFTNLLTDNQYNL